MEIAYIEGNALRILQFDATISENHSGTAVATERPVEKGISLTDHVRAERMRLTVDVHVSNTPVLPGGILGREHIGIGGSIKPLNLEDVLERVLTSGVEGSISTASMLELVTEQAGIRVPGRPVEPSIKPAKYEEVRTTSSVNTLQFDKVFDRVTDVYLTLERLRMQGNKLTVSTTLRVYDTMILTSVTTTRDVANRHATTFSLEFSEIRVGETQTTELPEPIEVRAKPKKNNGAQATKEIPETKKSQSVLDKLREATSSQNHGTRGFP